MSAPAVRPNSFRAFHARVRQEPWWNEFLATRPHRYFANDVECIGRFLCYLDGRGVRLQECTRTDIEDFAASLPRWKGNVFEAYQRRLSALLQLVRQR
jgi:hypothetical protein